MKLSEKKRRKYSYLHKSDHSVVLRHMHSIRLSRQMRQPEGDAKYSYMKDYARLNNEIQRLKQPRQIL